MTTHLLIDCFATDKYDAILRQLYRVNPTLEQDQPHLPAPTAVLLRDTDRNFPEHQRSGYFMPGPWGKQELGGTRWPDSYMVETRDP